MLKYFQKPMPSQFTWLFILAPLLLTACQSTGKNASLNPYHEHGKTALKSIIATDFAPDGTLWRLFPTEKNIFVDYSTDLGHSFSQPFKVNPKKQKINIWAENPPIIKVSRNGRIHVLYYADEDQQATTYFSYSDDQGRSFSTPILVSDEATTAMHYMDQMLVDSTGKVYFFWHDTRHGRHDPKLGSGVVSLYYTTFDSLNGRLENQKITGGICSCCRTATALAPNDKPVILARMVLEKGIRDHALIRLLDNNQWSKPIQAITDDWRVDACPEHGPAISIDDQGRSHLVWFTLGEQRQGIFYAHTDDYGHHVSHPPLPLGDPSQLPGHPDVLAIGDRVYLTWQQFDGQQTDIMIQHSTDRGHTWSQRKNVLSVSGRSAHPKLLRKNKKAFLMWSTEAKGLQLINITHN
ncbi:MAG: sialidase family protein [Methylococcales bacterium]|nr:sialidase family protein [Methylococcales bacterium]